MRRVPAAGRPLRDRYSCRNDARAASATARASSCSRRAWAASSAAWISALLRCRYDGRGAVVPVLGVLADEHRLAGVVDERRVPGAGRVRLGGEELAVGGGEFGDAGFDRGPGEVLRLADDPHAGVGQLPPGGRLAVGDLALVPLVGQGVVQPGRVVRRPAAAAGRPWRRRRRPRSPRPAPTSARRRRPWAAARSDTFAAARPARTCSTGRPTRPAIRSGVQPSNIDSCSYPAASSRPVRSRRCRFSASMSAICSADLPAYSARTSHGTVASPASIAAARRRWPNSSMCPPASVGVTISGSSTPTARMLSVSSVRSPRSVRGLCGLSSSCRGSSSSSTRPAAARPAAAGSACGSPGPDPGRVGIGPRLRVGWSMTVTSRSFRRGDASAHAPAAPGLGRHSPGPARADRAGPGGSPGRGEIAQRPRRGEVSPGRRARPASAAAARAGQSRPAPAPGRRAPSGPMAVDQAVIGGRAGSLG